MLLNNPYKHTREFIFLLYHTLASMTFSQFCHMHVLSIDPAPKNLPLVYLNYYYTVKVWIEHPKLYKRAPEVHHWGAKTRFWSQERRVSNFSIKILTKNRNFWAWQDQQWGYFRCYTICDVSFYISNYFWVQLKPINITSYEVFISYEVLGNVHTSALWARSPKLT